MANAILSGTFRVTDSSAIINRTFTASLAISAWAVQDITLPAGESNFIVSLPTVSTADVLICFATDTVRINFGGHASADSAASLGYQFKDLFARIGSSVSGDINIHFANSTADSATVTLMQAQG